MAKVVEAFLSTIKKEALIEPEDKIIIGLSGGADSVCLLKLLLTIKEEYNLKLAIAHINYGLRGLQSDEDESFVRETAVKHNLPSFIKKISLENGSDSNIQSKARDIRFRFFKEIIEKEDYSKLALGHNLDDLIENFFLRLCKGSLLRGLSSFSYTSNLYGIPIIRPLLDISKKEIISHLGDIQYKIDSSNLEPKYKRNEIRLKVLTALEEAFPLYRQEIAKTIKHLKKDSNYIQKQIKKEVETLTVKKGNNELSIDLIAFKKFGADHQNRILSEVIKVAFDIAPSQKAISDIIKKIEAFNYSGSSLLFKRERLLVYTEYNLLVFAVDDDLPKILSPIHLLLGETYNLHSYKLKVEDINLTKSIIKTSTKDNNERPFIILDKSKITELSVRNFISGDRIYFNKSLRYKKIKEILIDKKFPRFKRNKILVLLDKNNPIAILSDELIRLSERYYIDSKSKVAIKLTLE